MEDKIIRISKKIAEISSYYWGGICKIQKHTSTNPRNHAEIFIQNYAYERSASIDGYKKAAIKIINYFFDDIENGIDKEPEFYRAEFIRELKKIIQKTTL